MVNHPTKHSPVLLLLSVLCLVLAGCRHDVVVFPVEDVTTGDSCLTAVRGFYLLNEGNMGSNKASLDYYDFASGRYHRNIYAEANPGVVKELGDVGNDLRIYGNRLYAVINVSNKIEVMNAQTAERIGQINVPNCRYLCFRGRYGYVTSYAGPVVIDPDYKQIGYVARFDTATLQILDTCYVGFQPDELEIVGDKLYVANSGGYMVPNYENTVSVIDLASFRETGRIEVALNLHHLCADSHGGLWVSSRGDYYHHASRLYYIDTEIDQLVDSLPVACSNMWLAGDSLYLISATFSYETYQSATGYAIVDVRTRHIVNPNFITDGSEQRILTPYGLMVHPVTGDIYLTDAGNYVMPGYLYCFSRAGVQKWKVRTGDIPAHFALLW